ncbi:MAG: FAD-dependent oxidoreductase, partial [Zetaproteobacteria bacterium]
AWHRAIARALGVEERAVRAFQCVRRSLDARRKPKLDWVADFWVELDAPPKRLDRAKICDPSQHPLNIPTPAELDRRAEGLSVVIVGAGPAGLFAALALAEAGARVVVLERGKPIEARMRDIGWLRSRGVLDPESNLCFGEGGAGAYTDGKLYTRIKHPFVRWVWRRFVDFGAPEQILVDAHPHLGTDRLVRLVRRMRAHLLALGVELHFQTRMDALVVHDGRVVGVRAGGREFLADAVSLGVGHSARDTIEMLARAGVALEPKPFAVGMRAEHPQALINAAQYGDPRWAEIVGAAEYRLTHQVPDPVRGQRGVYSFCMCPGGLVVPAATEPERMVVNGMSNAKRAGPWANAGIVVQVFPEDWARWGCGEGALSGIAFQRALEEEAYRLAGGGYRAPAMRVLDFVRRKATGELAPTRFKPGVAAADLWALWPEELGEALREGLIAFGRKIKGFVSRDANLYAVESRTSSPVRIVRGDDMQSVSTPGLYPVGEGAGYAGGITSAAVDGLKAAAALLAR